MGKEHNPHLSIDHVQIKLYKLRGALHHVKPINIQQTLLAPVQKHVVTYPRPLFAGSLYCKR